MAQCDTAHILNLHRLLSDLCQSKAWPSLLQQPLLSRLELPWSTSPAGALNFSNFHTYAWLLLIANAGGVMMMEFNLEVRK